MAAEAPIYDLMVLLNLAATDDARAKTLGDARAQIERAGEIVGEHDWGQRTLAYPIERITEADYKLIQFRGGGELVSGLDRALRIDDAVVRHRIIKLAPGTPPPPDPGDAARAARPSRPADGDAVAAPASAPVASEVVTSEPAAGSESPAEAAPVTEAAPPAEAAPVAEAGEAASAPPAAE